MSNVHIRFDDDIDHYEPSDSENEQEKKILEKNYRKPRQETSDSEEEVFGLDHHQSDDDEDDDDEDDENIADSDVEGQEQDDLPDVRAWGKSKRDFYSTDYVDQDYGGYDGKDAQNAEFEEEEAKAIQIRLTEQLNDEDFMLNLFENVAKSKEDQVGVAAGTTEETIKSDLSTLSKRELQQLLRKESPELLFLIDDCKVKLEVVKYLAGVQGKIHEEMKEFVQTFQELCLNYVTNIFMYLLLKASKENPQKHPVLKRLYQYKKLIDELNPIYEEIVKPQIEIILNMNEEIARIKLSNKANKTNKKKVQFKPEKEKHQIEEEEEEEDDEKDEAQEEPENEEQEEQNEENTKRAITYQIAKNKGLTPHRKKELRNPRVKHRNKFRKAVIRRKGAVREVRNEIKRYGGEISGIKASVSKSIKLK